jgi:hypothetical protein
MGIDALDTLGATMLTPSCSSLSLLEKSGSYNSLTECELISSDEDWETLSLDELSPSSAAPEAVCVGGNHYSLVTRSEGAISWVSQRKKSTAQSSMEPEFITAGEASREVAWLEKFNRDRGDSSVPPTPYSDNIAAVDLIHDTKYHARAKHIDIRYACRYACRYAFRYAFIRNDMMAKERLNVVHIPGVNQPADILTKQLPVEAARRHLKTLGMTDVS